ncbi:MAG TPA: TonB-dependent receptor [Puia sp.]|nr:TonB-dependent receptor [Puia sp.]
MNKLAIFVIFLFISVLLHAQKPISGKITDTKTGAPLSGVSVKVKGGKGTSTDNNGLFTITAHPGQTLEISSIGYTPQVQSVTGDFLTITLASASTELTEMVFVGSRGAARSKTESPVPVDIINTGKTSITTARPDLMSQLNMVVPSFNYNKQSGSDGSDAIDFASLRGLGFDQTLVLVNGKRRHLSALVNQYGTRGRGNSGTDLNAIPEAAIDHIEILRDGASAQYGSDAIAGVMNIVLKKDVHHFNLYTGWSGYYDKKYNALNAVDPTQYYTGSWVDGNTFNLGADGGLALGHNGGFINLAGNFMAQGKTFRAEPDTNVTTNANALPIPAWRRAQGDGSVISGGGMFNMELPIAGSSTTFYSFGGYNYKHSNVYAWTRRWVNSANRIKFPTTPDGNLIFVPSIMHTYHTTDDSISAYNVFYDPQEDVYLKDASFAAGFRGSIGQGWDWDISNNTGYNDFHYWGNKTFNASLPLPQQATKNRFDDGGFNFLQNTANLDVNKRFAGVAQGLTLGLGAEFRYERYHLYAGEPDSYRNGGATLPDGTSKASGSEGYPGYQPSDAVEAHRTNVSGYVDLALDVTKAWLVDGAARFENYSDFGFVNTYKLATRYKLADNFNIRGSVSTGFRAPSLQQINFSNTNTVIQNGQLVYAKTVPNYSPLARLAGIPALKQETSVNTSLGFTWQPSRAFTITLDGYIVKMKNRVVATGYFDTTNTSGAVAAYLTANSIAEAQFFANAVNTTNTGLDIVIDYHKTWADKHFTGLLAGNIQHIHIDQVNIPGELNKSASDADAFFSIREQQFIKASAPAAKFSLALEYGVKKVSFGSHLTYWGKVTTIGGSETVTPDAGGNPITEYFVFGGKVTTDIYSSIKLSKTTSWILGIDNLFNVHPDPAYTKGAKLNSFGDSESGGVFDAVQMGSNGLHLFSKLVFNF